jgi:hypothetical protein
MAKSARRKPSVSKPSSSLFESGGSQVESWLTAAERKLLDGTLGRSLAAASQKQLQATMAKARSLRDKWQDLFNRQMKATKRTPRRAEHANSRSLDKAEMFAAAVRRVEARLGEMVDGVTAAVAGRKPAGRSTKPKSARSAGHRATRASVRKSLAKMTGPATKPAKPAAAARPKPAQSRPAAKPGQAVEAAASPAAGAGKRAGKPVTKPVTSKKARQAGKRKVAAAADGLVGYDSKKQRSAKASATAARIKLDGLSTRRRGHTLVAGKRKQARRDGR